MATKAFRTMDDIQAKEWDDLRCRVLFETHSWLSANELTLSGEPVITVEVDDGGLKSAITWQATDVTDPSPYYNVNALLARFDGEAQPKASGWTLNCVSVGPHSPMLAAPGIVFDTPRLMAHIAAAVETREDLPVMCGINFLPRDPVPGVPDALWGLGFQEFTGYRRSFLKIQGKSYDDYLANLGSRKRWSARRDRKRFVETEQTISFSAGSEAMGEDLVRLQGYNKEKYGQFYDEAETRTRFSTLLGSAGDDSLVVRSHRGAACTGFAMFFRMGESLHALCAGFEDTADRVSPYFECLFHAPIGWACEHNIKEIDYGVGSTDAKAERGCTIVDVATWYLQPVSWASSGE